jgi:hypothetical protein
MPVTTLVDVARTGSRPRKRLLSPPSGSTWVLMSTAVSWSAMHTPDGCGDIPVAGGGCTRYQVGAEELERVPSMVHRPDGTFRLVRSAPVGPTQPWRPPRTPPLVASRPAGSILIFRLGPTAGSQVTQPRSVCPRTSRCNSSYTAAPYRTHGSRPFNPPVITDEASPFALRSTRNHPRRAVHRRCPTLRLVRADGPAYQ